MSDLLFLMAVRATWVVAIATGATLLLRRNSASLRAAVWTGAIIALLAVPLLPRVEVTVPAPSTAIFASTVQQGQRMAELTVPVSPIRAGEGAVSPKEAVAIPLVPSIFFVGVWLMGWSKIRAWRIVRRMLERSSRAKVDVLAGNIARDLHLRRVPEIRLAKEETVPFTIGAWRPTIVLPASAATWDQGRTDMVLRHEMAHIERGDWLTLLLGQVVQVAFWFHPLVWFAVACLRLECEQATDDAVLANDLCPSDYASELCTWSQAAVPSLTLPMARHSGIALRLRRILDNRADRRRASAHIRVALVAFLLVCAIPVLGGAPGPSQMSLPDGSKVSIRRISTWNPKDGYSAWDVDGHRLQVAEDTDEKNIRDAMRQWAHEPNRLDNPAPNARWVAVSLALEESDPNPTHSGSPELRLTEGKEIVSSSFMPGPRRKGVAPVFTYVFAVDPDCKRSNARLDLLAGHESLYSEVPIGGKDCMLLSGPPSYVQGSSRKLTFFRSRTEEANSGEWSYFARFKWSNGATTGPADVSGNPDGFWTIGTETIPNAHVVSYQTLRRRHYQVALNKLPLYAQGGGG